MRLMSISTAGMARRSFISGSSECPPARTFASSPCSTSAATASSTDVGRTYSNAPGIMPTPRWRSSGARSGMRCPRMPSRARSSGHLLRLRDLTGGRAGLRRAPDRPDDVVVAGAAAEVALQPLADLAVGGVGVVGQDADGGHHHARGAEPALQAVLLAEGPLHRVHLAVGTGQALERGYLRAVGLGRQDRARLHRQPVHDDGARAARGGVAAEVGRLEPADLTQVVREQQPGFHLVGALLSVDGDRDLHQLPPWACWMARNTRIGVVGMSMCRTPRWATASMTAFCTAGVAPIVPASPMPFAPSAFIGVGVAISTSSKLGSSVAEMNG